MTQRKEVPPGSFCDSPSRDFISEGQCLPLEKEGAPNLTPNQFSVSHHCRAYSSPVLFFIFSCISHLYTPLFKAHPTMAS